MLVFNMFFYCALYQFQSVKRFSGVYILIVVAPAIASFLLERRFALVVLAVALAGIYTIYMHQLQREDANRQPIRNHYADATLVISASICFSICGWFYHDQLISMRRKGVRILQFRRRTESVGNASPSEDFLRQPGSASLWNAEDLQNNTVSQRNIDSHLFLEFHGFLLIICLLFLL
eukprot:TRINITY_DN151_c1_g1_i6.p1 TRINITY_DN151_c1_g1~~TRINITY_DN151_c1_g1_i6.p1  ORF type:complete len:177 (-),score=19.56 TRINITY_DN151_c1_g1_i6:209-739(-)